MALSMCRDVERGLAVLEDWVWRASVDACNATSLGMWCSRVYRMDLTASPMQRRKRDYFLSMQKVSCTVLIN